MSRSIFGHRPIDLQVFLEVAAEGVSDCTFFQSGLRHWGGLRGLVVFS